jgi:hypothetical protein
MATTRAKRDGRRVALFVEGVNRETPRGRDDLRELWRFLCGKVSEFPSDRIDVHGFTKLQIVIMDPNRAAVRSAGMMPLDVFIERAFQKQAFGRLVIAFDAHPANQAIPLIEGQATPCLQVEKDFVLSRLAASRILPEPFRDAAARLLAHYAENRAVPRARARHPIGEVELVYMNPTFEAMLLQDVKALRALFGLRKAPADWPALPFAGDRPDTALLGIVDKHCLAGPKHLRLRYKPAKHAWAQEILRNAGRTSAIWQHAIAQRLTKVLV